MKEQKDLRPGDPVIVDDPGLAALSRLAPEGSRPANHAIVDRVDGTDVYVLFPLDDNPFSEHSQSSVYDVTEVRHRFGESDE